MEIGHQWFGKHQWFGGTQQFVWWKSNGMVDQNQQLVRLGGITPVWQFHQMVWWRKEGH